MFQIHLMKLFVMLFRLIDVINSQTLKMISQVELFLCLDKRGTPEEDWRIQWSKCCVSLYHNKDEDNSPKNRKQNNTNQASSQSRVFTNGLWDWGSIPGWVIPKTQKIVLDAALLNSQYYKVWIKGKVEQSREWNSVLPYTLVL